MLMVMLSGLAEHLDITLRSHLILPVLLIAMLMIVAMLAPESRGPQSEVLLTDIRPGTNQDPVLFLTAAEHGTTQMMDLIPAQIRLQ